MQNWTRSQSPHTVTGLSTGALALLSPDAWSDPTTISPPRLCLRPFKSSSAPAARRSGGIAYSDWWKVFHDPLLDRLETQADAANQDIKIAIAHVDEAAAATKSAHSYLLPTIGAAPNVSRTREAQDRPNNGNTQGQAATYNDIQLPLVASYEIDAWGRIRRSVQSARATPAGDRGRSSICAPVSRGDRCHRLLQPAR